MTRQRWQNIRNLKEIPLDVWFEYYKENGGFISDIEEFKNVFYIMLSKEITIKNSKGEYVSVNLRTSLNRLYEYYNNKFKE